MRIKNGIDRVLDCLAASTVRLVDVFLTLRMALALLRAVLASSTPSSGQWFDTPNGLKHNHQQEAG